MTFIEELTEIQEQTNAIKEATKDILAMQEPECMRGSGCLFTPTYIIHNGDETNYYCQDCFMEALLDLVTSNKHVEFTEIAEKEYRL